MFSAWLMGRVLDEGEEQVQRRVEWMLSAWLMGRGLDEGEERI